MPRKRVNVQTKQPERDKLIKSYNALLDGYAAPPDGYHLDKIISIRVSDDDLKEIATINREFFEGELHHSTIGRILLHKGIYYYKKLSNSMNKHGL